MNMAYDPYARAKKTEQKVDWAQAAQQWIKSKEMYEQWQQQQQLEAPSEPPLSDNPPPPPPPPPPQHDHQSAPNQVRESSSASSEPPQNVEVMAPILTQPPPPVAPTLAATADWSTYSAYYSMGYSGWQAPVPGVDSIRKNFPSYENMSGEMGQHAAHPPPPPDTGKTHKLPLWIRDGLATMEKEKSKKPVTKNESNAASSSSSLKAHFSLDSDEDAEASNDSDAKSVDRAPKISGEEKKEMHLLMLKTWMTEILLEVTNSEMRTVANEVFKREANIIKNTSALNMIREEAASDSEPSDDEDAETLMKRGEQKRAAYEKRYLEELARSSGEKSENNSPVPEKRRSTSRGRRRGESRSRSRSRDKNLKSRNARRKTRSRSAGRRRDASKRRTKSRSRSGDRVRAQKRRDERSRSRKRSKRTSRSRSGSSTTPRRDKKAKKSHRNRSRS